MRILIVEDEKMLGDSLEKHLADEGFTVDRAGTFRSAGEMAFVNEYDCILLDLGLPDGDGLALLRGFGKKEKESGIIILTARGNIEDRIAGLNLGADDYLAKPFSMLELSARINAVLRRKFKITENTLTFGNLEIALDAKIVRVSGEILDLTKHEYAILLYLALNRHKTITRIALSEHIWGERVEEMFSLDVLNSHIKNIRKKLAEAGTHDMIKTVYGVGYRFEPEE